jgi:DNA repair protein RadA/Sms
MGKVANIWCCRECGHSQSKWSGSCLQCKNWNTLVEEVAIEDAKPRFEAKRKSARPMRIGEIKVGEMKRLLTRMGEVDRLFGGGIVLGSLSLVGGEPGVGKSTLMLQLAHSLATQGLTILYICGEESAEQTSLRALRLGIDPPTLYLFSETQFGAIKVQVDQLNPDVIIVDSVQILYKSEISSSPGSVVQVREIATEFMHLAKGRGITTFLIGHVTKSGELAGPRVLEHIVDTVLEFEGDRQHGFRMLRSMKNRFGPTDEIAIFQMKETGLVELPNPSAAFLQERMKEVPGSAIVPGLEGARSFLLEIQALVSPTAFTTPSRRSTGLDQNRLALLLAVLEKRVGFQLHHSDVFVALAGGLKILEPAIDLGIAMSLASSFLNRPIPPDFIVVGEIGLGGEIRGVSRIETRLKESIHMGFRKCVLPKRNCKGLSAHYMEKIQLIGVEIIDEAIQQLFGVENERGGGKR